MITTIIVSGFTILGYGFGWVHGYTQQVKDKEEAKRFVEEMVKLGLV